MQSRPSGLDMNVIPAWNNGYTGRGVVVSILDDGIEKDHPDLKRNYVCPLRKLLSVRNQQQFFCHSAYILEFCVNLCLKIVNIFELKMPITDQIFYFHNGN